MADITANERVIGVRRKTQFAGKTSASSDIHKTDIKYRKKIPINHIVQGNLIPVGCAHAQTCWAVHIADGYTLCRSWGQPVNATSKTVRTSTIYNIENRTARLTIDYQASY